MTLNYISETGIELNRCRYKIRILRNGKEKNYILNGGKIGIGLIDYPNFLEIEKDTKVLMANNDKSSDGYSGQKWAIIIGISTYPGWPLQNPPPVATSKSPTPVVVATGVFPPREGEIVSDRTGVDFLIE